MLHIICVVSISSDIWSQGWRTYAADPWHFVEMLNITLALTSIACFVIRCLLVVETVGFMKNNKSKNS